MRQLRNELSGFVVGTFVILATFADQWKGVTTLLTYSQVTSKADYIKVYPFVIIFVLINDLQIKGLTSSLRFITAERIPT